MMPGFDIGVQISVNQCPLESSFRIPSAQRHIFDGAPQAKTEGI